MKKQALLISSALMCAAGAFAQALPEGTTALLPAGVTANLSQNKQFYAQKNLCVAGSPEKGYQAFFQAKDAAHGEELWVTDGTAAGTRLVKDINPGVATSDIQYITRFNDKVVFSANDGENGYELWISDGTEAGTYMVKDIHELESSNPIAFCQLDENHMVFFATDFESETYAANPQQWLWITDGTEDGTKLVAQVDCTFPGQEEADNRWGAIMRVGRKVFFKADEADKDGVTHGVELWVTDGTPEGTHLVKDINLEPDVSKDNGSTLSPALAHMQNFYNEKLFFKAWSINSGNEPWATDGTEANTYEIFNTNPTVNENGNGVGGGVCMVGEPYKGNICFRAYDPVYGIEFGWTNCEEGDFHTWDIFNQEPTLSYKSYADGGVVFDDLYMFCAATGTDAAVESNKGGELHCFDGEKVWMQYDYAPGAGCDWVKEPLVVGGSLYWWNEGSLDGTGATTTKLHRLDAWDGVPTIVSNIDATGDAVYCLRNLDGKLLYTSSVTNQLYLYDYRQPNYDPEKNPDVMEVEFRTRAEIEADNTGVANPVVENNKVYINPNPVTDSFRVYSDEDVTAVRVYNLAGGLVISVNAPADNTVDASALTSGVYMVAVSCGARDYMVKMIVK